MQDVNKLVISLPPLTVQKNLVNVLDNFNVICSDLKIGLPAEINARKKQYEYYRDQLLTFAETGKPIVNTRERERERESRIALIRLCQYVFGYALVNLGQIGNLQMCKRILKSETTSVGDIPFYKIGTFGKEANAFITKEKFEEYRQKYPYPRRGDVLISAAGTIGRTVVFDGNPAYFQDSNIV